MDQRLEQAREAFVRGVEHFELGHLEPAESEFARALELAPGRPSILMNLGVTRVHLCKFADAIPLLEAAIAADAAQSDAWVALGLAQMELGHWDMAVLTHEGALGHGVDLALVHMRLGLCLARVGRIREAMDALTAAVQRDETLAEAWSQQGHLWRGMDQAEEAAQCYRRALEMGADSELHGYYLAALQPAGEVPSAPRAYVKTLFDQYADEFEGHLVGDLRYQGHRVLVEQLPDGCPPRFASVLDLGCGTGLCGLAIRPRADALWGLDLSGVMLEKARARGVYDRLIQGDLVEYLRDETTRFDLVLAADVFIYVGHLEDVFELLAQRIRPSGWLAFTLEEAEAGHSLQLLPSLRYAHSLDYVQTLATRCGFRFVAVHSAPLRFDQKTPVPGKYVYLQRA